ncbi:hypothetical protein V8E51_016126 [Hyaloscypha variabilis]
MDGAAGSGAPPPPLAIFGLRPQSPCRVVRCEVSGRRLLCCSCTINALNCAAASYPVGGRVDAGGGTGEEGRRKRREEEGRGEERREEKRAPSRRKHAPDVVVWRPPGGRQINESDTDSPSARIQPPACQFARLATSGIPCFFPVRCASMFGPEGPKCPPWPGGLTGRSSTDSAGDWETGRGTGWREISRSRSPSGGRYAAERQDIESVCRALSTNVDRDLHTERELENACATSPIWQWQAHATCSGSCAGWGVCPHDGWDFSRCSPGHKGWEFRQ